MQRFVRELMDKVAEEPEEVPVCRMEEVEEDSTEDRTEPMA